MRTAGPALRTIGKQDRFPSAPFTSRNGEPHQTGRGIRLANGRLTYPHRFAQLEQTGSQGTGLRQPAASGSLTRVAASPGRPGTPWLPLREALDDILIDGVDMKLAGQVALITGASGGIGSAICLALAREGASLAVHYHSRGADAVRLAEEMQRDKALPAQRFLPLAADLLDDGAAGDLVTRTVEALGRLDIVVNNAGWTRVVQAQDLEGLDDEMISRTVRMKIDAPLYLVRAARPHLEQSGAGQVINITSVAGIAAKGSSIVYAAANAALSNLTRSLARALAPKIRVNAVAPGFVETGFAWPKDGKVKSHVAQRNHISRTVEAGEVAEVVRFLACDAPAITGEEIAIDGGIGRLGVR